MRHHLKTTLISMACLAMAGCQQSAKPPTGQVAATVDGQEITQREIDLQLAGAHLGNDPHAVEAARSRVLQSIIARKLLVKAAKDQGLDKTPDFAIREQSNTETLLAQALEAKILNEVPTPTADDAQEFIRQNPDIFAERKIFSIDQIRFVPPAGSNVLHEIQPLNSLDDIAAVLTREKIPFQRGVATLDAVGADPKLIEQIVQLKPGTVFILPTPNSISANQVKDVKVEPFVGDAAAKYAMQALLVQRRREALQRYVGQIMAKASERKAVVLNKMYQATKAPAPAPSSSSSPASSSPEPQPSTKTPS